MPRLFGLGGPPSGTKTESVMFQHQAKLALRTDRRCTAAIEYAVMTAFVAMAVVMTVGTVTPRLQAAVTAIAAPMTAVQ